MVVAARTGVLPAHLGSRRAIRRESKTAALLRQAGLSIPVGRFHAGCGAVACAVFVMLYGLNGVGVVATAPAIFSAFAPRWWVARRAASRVEGIQRAWPDALRDMVASIGAGLSLQHALERLGDTGPEALREVFSQFSITARAVGMVPALEAVRDDLADPTSDRVVEVLFVAHEKGGAIVPEVLRDLATATTRDIWLMEQVRTESLEQRINARAVFALPWLVLIAITLQDGPFRDFYRSGAGIVVIGIGGLASALGMMLASRLGAQPVEQRVFGRRR
jgi:tight adherence protein B